MQFLVFCRRKRCARYSFFSSVPQAIRIFRTHCAAWWYECHLDWDSAISVLQSQVWLIIIIIFVIVNAANIVWLPSYKQNSIETIDAHKVCVTTTNTRAHGLSLPSLCKINIRMNNWTSCGKCDQILMKHKSAWKQAQLALFWQYSLFHCIPSLSRKIRSFWVYSSNINIAACS